MAAYKQSVAYTRAFLMIDSSDHVTGKTGLTVAVTLSKAGAAFGAAGGTVTELSGGWYKIALTTTDTNTQGDLAVHCTSTGADPTDFSDQVWALDPTIAQPTNWASLSIDTNGRMKALVDVQKNVAFPNFTFLLTDASTHVGLTGKVNADFTLKKERIAAGAAASLSGTITEVDATNLPGVYTIDLTAGEVNGKVITLYFTTADSDPTVVTLVTSD